MRRADLQLLAKAKRDDAVLLLQNKRYSNAYYLAGYAAELGLKACIARVFAADDIPDKSFVNDIHTHQLQKLIGLAGLQTEFQNTQKANENFAVNWALVAQWTEAARYQSTDPYTAQITIDALTNPNSGVFQWIEQHW
jgi:HEPN domain-containing protein